MTIEYKAIEKLKGSINYASWENQFFKFAILEGWKTDTVNDDGTVDTTWSSTGTKIKEIKTYLISTIDQTISDYNISKSVEDIINLLRASYGSSYVNATNICIALKPSFGSISTNILVLL